MVAIIKHHSANQEILAYFLPPILALQDVSFPISYTPLPPPRSVFPITSPCNTLNLLRVPPSPNLFLDRNCKLTDNPAPALSLDTKPALPTLHRSISPNPAVSQERYRPNTKLDYLLFTPHSQNMPAGQLRSAGWEHLTTNFPDPEVIRAILGICTFGTQIGYRQQRSEPIIHPNLAIADPDATLVSAYIIAELNKNRLDTYSHIYPLPTHYTASSLGLVDKADGSKRRIHHLSYPPDDPTAINNGIPEQFVSITYCGIEDAVSAIQKLGKRSKLIKCDLESAFRHIPVSPYDSPLLGFHWQNCRYAERFLPFGLRTAPYLFNLFAEVFHWILEDQLIQQNMSACVIHYLDDFLIVIPAGENPDQCSQIFASLCRVVGLTINNSKNEQGTVTSFAGLEFDSHCMIIQLPENKLAKARTMIKNIAKCRSVSLHDLQKLTGYLNLLSTVVPLGRTFFVAYTIWNYIFRAEADILEEGYRVRQRRTLLGGDKYFHEYLNCNRYGYRLVSSIVLILSLFYD